MIRTVLTTDDRINSLVLKAQRILYETANRIQNLIDAQENNT